MLNRRQFLNSSALLLGGSTLLSTPTFVESKEVLPKPNFIDSLSLFKKIKIEEDKQLIFPLPPECKEDYIYVRLFHIEEKGLTAEQSRVKFNFKLRKYCNDILLASIPKEKELPAKRPYDQFLSLREVFPGKRTGIIYWKEYYIIVNLENCQDDFIIPHRGIETFGYKRKPFYPKEEIEYYTYAQVGLAALTNKSLACGKIKWPS